jgi:hypothetical protein
VGRRLEHARNRRHQSIHPLSRHKKGSDYRFWVRQAVLYATPVPSLHIARYLKNYTDPTTRDIKFIMENRKAALFHDTQKMRFDDSERFDFRGESSRSVNGRSKRLADSNERSTKGFAYTFALPRDYKGVIGRTELDSIFVKPVEACPGHGEGERFAAYYGHTMMDLNRVFAEETANHAPIAANMRLTSDRPDDSCPAAAASGH